MPHVKIPRRWEIPEREATPERLFLERRSLLRGLGAAALLTAAGCSPGGDGAPRGPDGLAWGEGLPPDVARLYPAPRDPRWTLDRPLTDEAVAASYNNFYEFSEEKGLVAAMAREFPFRPWAVQIAGLVAAPRTIDVDEIVRRGGLEERLYRHRCVEAWAMAVPWTGLPLAKLIELAAPLGSARYVRFSSFLDPGRAPGQRKPWYPWPYYEALTLAEATHELAFLATGVYGHPLPPQHGAPIRLVVPWKYGYKSLKSVVRMELTAERPGTFWSDTQPAEYGFEANVDPAVPHPRWSQATERLIGTGRRVPTLPFNGYAAEVAGLYRS